MNKKNLKLLFSFYRPYRGLFAADLICSLASAGIALAVPLGVRFIAGMLLDAGDYSRVLWSGLAALVAVQALCT